VLPYFKALNTAPSNLIGLPIAALAC